MRRLISKRIPISIYMGGILKGLNDWNTSDLSLNSLVKIGDKYYKVSGNGRHSTYLTDYLNKDDGTYNPEVKVSRRKLRRAIKDKNSGLIDNSRHSLRQRRIDRTNRYMDRANRTDWVNALITNALDIVNKFNSLDDINAYYSNLLKQRKSKDNPTGLSSYDFDRIWGTLQPLIKARIEKNKWKYPEAELENPEEEEEEDLAEGTGTTNEGL